MKPIKVKLVSIEEYNKKMDKIIKLENLFVDKKIIKMLDYASSVKINSESEVKNVQNN